MSVIDLHGSFPTRLELHSTSWQHTDKNGRHSRSVFFTVNSGKNYVTTVSMTPDDARQFGQMLIDEAAYIEKNGYQDKPQRAPAPSGAQEG